MARACRKSSWIRLARGNGWIGYADEDVTMRFRGYCPGYACTDVDLSWNDSFSSQLLTLLCSERVRKSEQSRITTEITHRPGAPFDISMLARLHHYLSQAALSLGTFAESITPSRQTDCSQRPSPFSAEWLTYGYDTVASSATTARPSSPSAP